MLPKSLFTDCYYPPHCSKPLDVTPKATERVIQFNIPIMASQTYLDVSPLQTPHLDINHLPLADREFQIKDIASPAYLLKLHCWCKDKFLNQNDEIHL